MNSLFLPRGRGPYDWDIFAYTVEALHDKGYVVLNNVFSTSCLQSLFKDIKNCDRDEFHEAGVGRETDYQVNHFIRRDRIRWLDKNKDQAASFYFDWIENLRLRVNKALFLGLFDFECHYAHYPKGAFYKKHLDSFKGNNNRRLSTVLYLNPSWQACDGGELVLYAVDSQEILETILPTFGTLVLFLSEEFPHEVLPSNQSRYTLTGWFRVNDVNDFMPAGSI